MQDLDHAQQPIQFGIPPLDVRQFMKQDMTEALDREVFAQTLWKQQPLAPQPINSRGFHLFGFDHPNMPGDPQGVRAIIHKVADRFILQWEVKR